MSSLNLFPHLHSFELNLIPGAALFHRPCHLRLRLFSTPSEGELAPFPTTSSDNNDDSGGLNCTVWRPRYEGGLLEHGHWLSREHQDISVSASADREMGYLWDQNKCCSCRWGWTVGYNLELGSQEGAVSEERYCPLLARLHSSKITAYGVARITWISSFSSFHVMMNYNLTEDDETLIYKLDLSVWNTVFKLAYRRMSK